MDYGMGSRGLSLYKQSLQHQDRNRFVVFQSKSNGKLIVVDTLYARYTRMRKRIKSWVDVVAGEPDARCVMLTLTYKPGQSWQPNDIRDFMSSLKRLLGARLYGYAWVAELQARGAMHYHVICYVRRGTLIPRPDTSGMWSHGLTKIETAKSPYYVLKYTGKEAQKDYSKFPPGARSFAVYLCDRLLKDQLRYMSLKPWEQIVVDAFGWQELPLARETHTSDWKMKAIFRNRDSAEDFTELVLQIRAQQEAIDKTEGMTV